MEPGYRVVVRGQVSQRQGYSRGDPAGKHRVAESGVEQDAYCVEQHQHNCNLEGKRGIAAKHIYEGHAFHNWCGGAQSHCYEDKPLHEFGKLKAIVEKRQAQPEHSDAKMALLFAILSIPRLKFLFHMMF
jgi:hypothetical protein